jgi:hypothetical protein
MRDKKGEEAHILSQTESFLTQIHFLYQFSQYPPPVFCLPSGLPPADAFFMLFYPYHNHPVDSLGGFFTLTKTYCRMNQIEFCLTVHFVPKYRHFFRVFSFTKTILMRSSLIEKIKRNICIGEHNDFCKLLITYLTADCNIEGKVRNLAFSNQYHHYYVLSIGSNIYQDVRHTVFSAYPLFARLRLVLGSQLQHTLASRFFPHLPNKLLCFMVN